LLTWIQKTAAPPPTDSKKAEKKKRDAAEAKDMAFTDTTIPGHKKGNPSFLFLIRH